ncbi:MAG: 3-phosphoshikimate 1-carboxyvinyltransferase [Spirochaetales bacterium]|nr:3-phosphoshikimate 1-carboxyvinyltransferase [Spirochaetales bacterium]
MDVSIEKCRLAGEVKIPASKSHTIRAVALASLANGKSMIREPLVSRDTKASVDAYAHLGAGIRVVDDGWEIEGTGGRLKTPSDVINVENSGTTLYIAAGSAALQSEWVVLTGDDQIRKRPITHLLDSLRDLGAKGYSTRNNGCAPVVISGPISGGRTSIKCPTSQYLTSLLINCPLAEGDSEIHVLELNERPYVQMTLDWLERLEARVIHEDMKYVRVKGGHKYRAFERRIPADFSSATFFLCAAAITASELTLIGLDMNDSQGDKEVVTILEKMGCRIDTGNNRITIKGGELKGGEFDLNSIPDSLPALAVTACFAEGTTRFYNVAQARLKETDRIAVMKEELTRLGARVEERPDGLEIKRSLLKGTRVNGHDDHRVVMALSVAGLAIEGTTTITTAEAANVTFPEFFNLLERLKSR